jgi:hypothetical protein
MDTIRRDSWYGVALFTLSGLLLSGCGSELDEVPPDLESRESPALICNEPNGCCDPAIYESCRNQMKSTPNGYRVVVTIFVCLATPTSTTPLATCRVHPTDYAIGGGVFVQNTAAAPIGSVPIFGLGGGWRAASAGITGPVAHSLKTYAIGLQVLDPSFRTVNIGNDIHRYNLSANTGDPNRLSGSVNVAAGDLLIGGGWSGSGGVFAVDAYATGMSKGKWTVNGKQFRDGAGAAQLNGVAIGLSRCLPAANPIFCFGSRDIIEKVSTDSTGVRVATAYNTHPEQFVVGVGGMSSSWERPLWGMYPLAPGLFGSPSEHGSGAALTVAPGGDSGHVTTQIMTIGI